MDSSVSARKASVVRAAVEAGLIAENVPYISLVDYAGLEATVARLHSAFPGGFLHTFAVKANFFIRVLETLRQAGMGAEVASEGEYRLAMRAGFRFQDMVFDAPIKTRAELERALTDGVTVNIDNFQEFAIVRELAEAIDGMPPVGFRINPQVGGGAVSLSSTATQTSKFGVGLCDPGNRERLISLYRQIPWLNALHVHVGSVACPLQLMAEGIRATVDLAEEINDRCGEQRVEILDMGGGMPVSFEADQDTPDFADYAAVLRDQVPELFSGRYRVITEFGRAIVAKQAMGLARVEYTKSMGGRSIALTHAGAAAHIRTVLQPESWARRVSAFDARGCLKQQPSRAQDVAGPCCFAGDIIAHERDLPALDPGDLVLVHDTGAYFFANHFQYNALPVTPVHGFRIGADGAVVFDCISPGQTLDELVESFASAPASRRSTEML